MFYSREVFIGLGILLELLLELLFFIMYIFILVMYGGNNV